MTAPIRSMDQIVDAMRARKEELDLPNDIIDELAGLPMRYTSKVMARMRSPGYISLGPMLEVLGLGIKIVEDQEALARIKHRHTTRKRPQKAYAPSIAPAVALTSDQQKKIALRERMKQIGMLAPVEARSAGGKRRAKILGKRARKRIARQAATARWARQKAIVLENQHSCPEPQTAPVNRF